MVPPPRGSLPLPGLRWRGLNLQFFAFFFLPLVAILMLVVFGSLSLHQRAMRQLVGERDERAARTAAAAISEQINHRAAAVRGLALRAADRTPPTTILNSSAFLYADFDHGLALYSPQGELLAATRAAALWGDFSGELANLLNQARQQAGERVVFSPVLSTPEDERLVFLAFTVAPQTPAVLGAFSPATLARRTLTGAFSPRGGSAAFLVSADHQIIYQIGAITTAEEVATHPGVAEALRGESGTTYLQVGESEHVIAFSPITTVGWALVIEEPWESVSTPLLNTTQLAPLALAPVLLLALLALWFGARQIVQPLQELEARAAELAWGNYRAIEGSVGGIDEIRRLQGTLVHLAGKVQRAQDGLRQYIGAITTGQEEERRRLARELHDDTIQALIALNQRVQLTQLKLAADPEARAALEEIQRLAENTIQDLRRLTRALRPLYLEDLGLVAALEMLARETELASGISVTCQQAGTPRRLPAETELALYRIAQEALNNVIRHAGARNAALMLCFEAQQVVLTVQDDGVGFDPPENPAEFAPNGHYGLLGMHERAELIGARLTIHTAPSEGTRLSVTLPDHPNTK